MRALLLLLLLCSGGCAFARFNENEPLAPELLAGFAPGQTTAREVVARLGAPTDIVWLGKRTAYRYDHLRRKVAGTILILVNLANFDERSDRIWLFFDEQDVLTHFAGTFAAERTEYAFPWENLHDENPPPGQDAPASGK
jgi:hypothetical protein